MKQFILLFAICILGFGLFFGCDDDKEEGPITPGDNNDPDYLIFYDEYEGMDEITGDMVGMMFEFIDSIAPSAGLSLAKPSDLLSFSVTYHSSSGYWYCTALVTDELDTFDIVDSIQFKQGTEVVQFPDMDLVTEVKSFLRLVASGPEITTGVIVQNLVVTTPNAGSDTLIINGTGDIDVTTSYVDTFISGTNSCDVVLNYNYVITDVIMDMSYDPGEEDVMCPLSGTIDFTGAVDISCSGVNNFSVSGSWNVIRTFDHGDVTIVINNGTNSWTINDTCYVGDPGITVDDSLVVSDILDEDEIFSSAFKSLDVSIALLDSIPGGPAKIAGGFRSTEGDEEVIITAVNSYSYENGWHIFDFDAMVVNTIENDTAFVNGVDSIKFLSGSVPVRYPAGTEDFDELNQRAHAGWYISWGEDYGRVNHSLDLSLAVVELDTIVTINGTVRDTMSITAINAEGVCAVDVTLSEDITNLQINVNADNDCPLAGEIDVNATLDVVCTGEGGELEIHSDITITAVVNNDGTITISYIGNIFSWEVTQPCAGDVVTKRSVWTENGF